MVPVDIRAYTITLLALSGTPLASKSIVTTKPSEVSFEAFVLWRLYIFCSACTYNYMIHEMHVSNVNETAHDIPSLTDVATPRTKQHKKRNFILSYAQSMIKIIFSQALTWSAKSGYVYLYRPSTDTCTCIPCTNTIEQQQLYSHQVHKGCHDH